MARKPRSSTKYPANRFYHSAKVSEYQFKRVLWAFVTEEPVAEAARRIRLSANSINAIYGKLRVFFTELGVFYDIYKGGNPRDGTEDGEDIEEFEHKLLTFHLQRIRDKRRMKGVELGEVDHHWCESHWRFQYNVMSEGRPSDAVLRMMFSHLMAHIRASGPIGQPPRSREASAILSLCQFQQRVLWLERNAPAFRDATARAELREIRRDDAS